MKLLLYIFPARFCLSSPKSSNKVSQLPLYWCAHSPDKNIFKRLVQVGPDCQMLKGVFLCFNSKLNH